MKTGRPPEQRLGGPAAEQTPGDPGASKPAVANPQGSIGAGRRATVADPARAS